MSRLMTGTMDSCQPTVTLMESHPAFSASWYTIIDSSWVLPPTSSSCSQAQMRMISGMSRTISARTALMMSVMNLQRA